MADRIYLDYQATVPVRPEVVSLMNKTSLEVGNPNSAHSFGRKSAGVVLSAKDELAKFLNVSSRDIAFTSGSTESIEIGLMSVVARAVADYPDGEWEILTSPVEHSAVLDTCTWIHETYPQITIRYVKVDEFGQIDLENLQELLSEKTLMVSVMYANNEIGTIYPLRKIGKMVQKSRNERESVYPIFHTDATQAPLYLDCDIHYLGVDLLSLSAHKVGGPIGIGALWMNERVPVQRIRPGKGEESGLKSGTTSATLAAGFGEAIRLISSEEKERVSQLQRELWGKLEKLDGIYLNGPSIGEERLPCNIHISTSIPAEELLIRMDMEGVAVSAGSACHSRAIEPSHVMKAITEDDLRIRSALRLSFGYQTTEDELDFFVKMLSNSIT